jgi:hypothetical protein
MENREATLQVGGSTPYIAGMTVTGGGKVAKTFAHAQTGAEARITAHLTPDGEVLIDFKLVERGMRETETEIGKDDKGIPVLVMELLTATVESKLAVAPDHARLVEGVKTQSKSGNVQTLVIVGARVR